MSAVDHLLPRGADEPAAQPGADYLLSRLARAQAVPAAERSREVQAFIDGVALLRQVSGHMRGCLPLRTPLALPDASRKEDQS